MQWTPPAIVFYIFFINFRQLPWMILIWCTKLNSFIFFTVTLINCHIYTDHTYCLNCLSTLSEVWRNPRDCSAAEGITLTSNQEHGNWLCWATTLHTTRHPSIHPNNPPSIHPSQQWSNSLKMSCLHDILIDLLLPLTVPIFPKQYRVYFSNIVCALPYQTKKSLHVFIPF